MILFRLFSEILLKDSHDNLIGVPYTHISVMLKSFFLQCITTLCLFKLFHFVIPL